jgi:hypothetical protein
MTDEACKDLDEFYERLKRMSLGTFSYRIHQVISTMKKPNRTDLDSLVPYSSVCWMPAAREDRTSEDIHIYQRRATRCLGCTEYTELFIWNDNDPTHLLGCISAEIGFVSRFISGWRTRFWFDNMHVSPFHPVLHDVITRTALTNVFPSVVPPFYAYGCAERGVVVEWMPQFAESFTKPWKEMQDWLDMLDKVDGFLVAPNASLFDAQGRISDLSTLCWSHPENPSIRWMAPMRVHPTRMQIPDGGVDASDLKSMRSWQRWFYECVRGAPTTPPPNPSMNVRRWNTWITWCSLAMSSWPEGQADILAPVQPKNPLHGYDACLTYLWSL